MRVYVATTPAALPALRAQGLPAGTEGYAATAALAQALGLPVDGGEDTAEELGESVLQAAAEASLLLLAEQARTAAESGEDGETGADEETGADDETGSGTGSGTGAGGGRPARRVVVVVEARARPVEEADHPATVVLTAPLRWSAVESLLADDATAAGRVARAAVLALSDQDRAVDRLERDQLGWFGPDELG